MSHENSVESSLDPNFQIHTNNQGENQLYIPWQQQGSNSTQYQHLIEETKYFKNKCKHLESHLEENHKQFSSLNQLYLIAESNERKFLKQNEQLRRKNKEQAYEINRLNELLENTNLQIYSVSKRQSDLKERLFKSKQRQNQLQIELENMEKQIDLSKRRATISPRNNEDEKLKKLYSQQIAELKAVNEQLQLQFDKKSKQIKEKNDQIKGLNRSLISARQESQQKMKNLESELEELKRQLTRIKTLSSDQERQVKELKEVLEEVSIKNDQIQRDNGHLKTKLKEQNNKYAKLSKQFEKQITIKGENQIRWKESEDQISLLLIQIQDLKLKLQKNEKQLRKSRIVEETAQNNYKQLQHLCEQLKEQLNNQRLKKQAELMELNDEHQEETNNLKNSYDEQIQKLQQIIISQRGKNQLLRDENQRIKRQSGEMQVDQEQITRLKEEILMLKIKIDQYNNKDRLIDSRSSNISCGHGEQIKSLKQQIKREIDGKQQLKSANVKANKIINDFNAKLEENNRIIEQLIGQKQKLLKQKRRLLQQKQALYHQNSKLEEDRKIADKANNKKINSQNSDNSQKYKQVETRLKLKLLQIQQLTERVGELQNQLQQFRLRSKDQIKDNQKQRFKRMEAKLNQKNKQIQVLEEKINHLQINNDQLSSKSKKQQKENKNMQNELTKKQRKIKELQTQANDAQQKNQHHQNQKQNLRQDIQNMKKQLKNEQMLVEKLRHQLVKDLDQKENIASHDNQIQKKHDTERNQWETKVKNIYAQLKEKEELNCELNKQITQLNQKINSTETRIEEDRPNKHEQHQFNRRIRQLQMQLREKQDVIQRLQTNKTDRDTNNQVSGNLEQLEAEYNRELMALKRLIVFKGYKQDEGRNLQQVKMDYQSKFQLILTQYRSMQQQMIQLKSTVLSQQLILTSSQPNYDAMEQSWRIKLQQIIDQRQILIDKVAMWQKKYNELRYLFETKIDSKDQTINLLNLKLNNMELSRSGIHCHCSYHR